MFIQSVELENVKSYASAHVRFSEGVNAIVGHNGAGKSTLLEAIGFALFDAIQYKQAEFIREQTKTATVTVTFVSSLDERPYQVVRRVGGVNQQYVYDPESQSKICSGSADVAAFVRQHTGVDPTSDLERLFRDAVGVPQGTLTAAFLEQPARRKPIFDPLLQVEEYQQAFAGLLDAKNLVRDRQREVDVQIAGLTALVQQLPNLEQEHRAAQQEYTVCAQRLAADQAQLQSVEAARARLEEARQRVTTAELRRDQARHKVEMLAGQAATARRALEEGQKAYAIVQQNQPGYDLYTAAMARRQELEGQARQRQQALAALAAAETEAALARSRIEQRQRELEAISAAEQTVLSLAAAVAEQSQLERDLATAREQAARLRDVQQELDRSNQAFTQAQKRLAVMLTDFGRVAVVEVRQATTQTELARLREELQRLTAEQGALRSEADAAKRQTRELEDAAGARCPVCEQPLSPAHRSELLARNEQRLAQLRVRYVALEKESKTAAAAIQQQEAALSSLQNELRSLPTAAAVAEMEKTLADLETTRNTVQARLAELSGAPERAAVLESRLAGLGDPRAKNNVAVAEAQRRSSVEKALAEAEAARAHSEQDVARLQAEVARFAGLDQELESVNGELTAHAAAYQAVLANHQTAATLDERRKAVLAAEDAQRAGQAGLTLAEQELAEAVAGFDAPTYETTVRMEQELRTRVGGLRTQMEMLQRQLERQAAEIGRMHEQQAELAKAQSRREKLTQLERTLETLRNTIKQAGPYITRALIGQISEGAAQIFGDLMNDYTRRLEWNEDYSITLDVGGIRRQFAQLSGGEQMSAALAVRLALLREMSAIDVAFFDEPTSNLDSERRDALARQILSVKGFRQLFVISHDDAFEQVTQNLIRVERVDGVSRIVEGV